LLADEDVTENIRYAGEIVPARELLGDMLRKWVSACTEAYQENLKTHQTGLMDYTGRVWQPKSGDKERPGSLSAIVRHKFSQFRVLNSLLQNFFKN
jgi:hypothetical protein